MSAQSDMKELAVSIIDSYEMRVSTVTMLMTQANNLLKSFQIEMKEMITQLRDNLAKSESLRKKDFDIMIHTMVDRMREIEQEAENRFNQFQQEESEMIGRFRCLVSGESPVVIEDMETLREDVLTRQKERERRIVNGLKQFQLAQEEIRSGLKTLLLKGNCVRIKDLKQMLKTIQVHQCFRDPEIMAFLDSFDAVRDRVQHQWREVLACSR
jgi:flagellar hook-basal body complex protein FliE